MDLSVWRTNGRMSDEFSEEGLKTALATTETWYDAFAESPEFARLTDSQKRKAGAITEFFTSYTYQYLGSAPSDWDRGDVVECCTDILPRKVSAEPPFFEAIAPVLSAFFEFLASQSLLRNGRALAEVAACLNEQIVANAGDRSNWGPAKHFVMAAQEAGVDIQDAAALNAFMLQYNLERLARSKSARARPSSWASPDAAGPAKKASQPPAGRYDPCPCGSGKKFKFCCEGRD
ncbi:MAG: SEC-C domain-containing protein [Verrucomicrobia bacterium]|nr:SEC-C domain-containing protein [Verrucomicrobiota bacterium]